MTSNFSFHQDFNSDDEDQPEIKQSGRDATLVVIDCKKSMFDEIKDEDGLSLFTKCLSVLERYLLNKIIHSNKDLLGVLLYNVDKSPEPKGNLEMESPLVVPANCAILIPMMQTEPEIIQYVKNIKNSDDLMDFENKFGHSENAKIADLLWLCSSMFSSCGRQINVPQIIWFTNDDSPHAPNSNDFNQAFQKAKDLQQLRLDIQFHPMKLDFDGELFFKELLCQLLNYDIDEYQFPTPQLNENLLLKRTFRKGYDKRSLAYLTVELSPNAKFGVGIYSFTRTASYPKPIMMTRNSLEQVNVKRSYKFGKLPEEADGTVDLTANIEKDFDYSEKLEPSMTVKFLPCGGENIKFTPLEAYGIKQVMEPKIKLLGFKPLSVLNELNHFKPSYFIYPNDSHVKNSKVFFRALWERCLADEKVIICTCTQRLKSNPRLVALVPTQQDNSPDGEMQHYDGFRMYFIPFAGDIRDLTEVLKEPPPVDQDVSAAMKKVISRLRVNYNSSMFENPIVKQLYTKIEEQVYDEDADDELRVDATLPNLDAQSDRIGQFVDKLSQLMDGFEEGKPASKRKAPEASGELKKKKATADDVDQEFVLKKCQEGDTKHLTVAILKTYLELKNASGISKMNKAQIIEKIVELG